MVFPAECAVMAAIGRTSASGKSNSEEIKNDIQRRVRSKDTSIKFSELEGKSDVLKKFTRVECDGVATPYAACRKCFTVVKYGSDSGTSGLKRHNCKGTFGSNQPSISSFVKRKLPSGVKSHLADKIARMCSQDLRPFAIVEGKGFIKVAQEMLDIGAKYGSNIQVEDILPSARTVSRHVEGEYDKVKRLVLEELQQITDYAVTTDLWTEERTNTHYITVTVHYILDWKIVNRILATREMEGVKSSEHIRRTVEGILQEFGALNNNNVFVTDNGSNVVAAFKDYVRLSCAGHNINLVLKHVFDHLNEDNPVHSRIIKLFKETKTLVTHFKRAGLQKELDQSLKQAVETRWNTRLAMLQSVNDALRSGKLHDILLRRNELRYLNNIDSELLENLIHLLKPFDEATRHLSTDQTPTLHLVLPTKATLLRGLLIQDGDSKIVAELKEKLAQAVEIKFKVHLYHKVATALSPSLRTFLKKTLNGEEYEEVISTLTTFTETTGKEKTVTGLVEKEGASPMQGVSEVHNFFSSCVEEESKDTRDEESQGRQSVVQYLNDTKLTRLLSLLDFWREMSGGLEKVAKRLLAIPATSTSSERCFSVAGRLIEERRSTLAPENVDALIFLHSNS
uniref:BED-type domain-containing protein n=1 Tax=Oryzias melastigma TaxID=30732 RepID=A0A3B3BG73_ORYME